MEEVLDSFEQDFVEPVNLRRAVRLLILNISLLVLVNIAIIAVTGIENLSPLIYLLIGLPSLATVVLAPVGFFYSVKSYKRKEGKAITRLLCMIGHTLFCSVIAWRLISVAIDVAKLF